MKKVSEKIAIGVVSISLGFMITYQIKAIAKQNNLTDTADVAKITLEVEQLNKQKEEMEEKINELQGQVKNYETSAASNDTMTKAIVNELENTRMLTGKTDVIGSGTIITITPTNDIFAEPGAVSSSINVLDLISLINELNYAGAEAISVNDVRITARTGINNAGDIIIINDVRISPNNEVVIKAIGNKKNLKGTLDFPGVIDGRFGNSNIKIEYADDVKILKYALELDFKYAETINND
ncbi:DUF881 domain-containing protein [Clostridium sp. DL1XJH146]